MLIRDAECTSFEAKIYMEGIPYCQRLPTRSAVRRTNLFDDHYEEILGVPLPGRWFGVEASLNL